MQWIVEDSLTNFPFWSSAADRAKMLTHSELQELDELLSEHYGENVPPASEINDLFMFKFGDVCSLLGLNYDKERNVIIRDEANLESVNGECSPCLKASVRTTRLLPRHSKPGSRRAWKVPSPNRMTLRSNREGS